jgi:STE24 endopeptidase
MRGFSGVVGGLLLARWGAQVGLERLNRRHLHAQATAVPEPLPGGMDPATHSRSVDYTLAKSRLRVVEDTYGAMVLAAVLFSGVLPWAERGFGRWVGRSVWSMAAFLVCVGLIFSLLELPLAWHAQFHLEQRFGFNTTTPKLWWADRVKGLVLGLALGLPLLALVLKLADWTGRTWWLWGWGCVLGFQWVMSVVAPVLILPWFNRFTPLPEGALRDRLMALARRTGFGARTVQVMDGSKRSLHSNAFFVGLGRFRKIVLFDTLMGQLEAPELEAVLAHEIGHYRKHHVPKTLLASAVGLLAAFYALAWLAGQDWFDRAFGFAPGDLASALLLFGLLGGPVVFWLAPVVNSWSRRYEYQADAFAAGALGESRSLVAALRKLNVKNLSNPAPHPVYSFFYYSHPTLVERERALGRFNLQVVCADGWVSQPRG